MENSSRHGYPFPELRNRWCSQREERFDVLVEK
jgi:hypothetical protein